MKTLYDRLMMPPLDQQWAQELATCVEEITKLHAKYARAKTLQEAHEVIASGILISTLSGRSVRRVHPRSYTLQ